MRQHMGGFYENRGPNRSTDESREGDPAVVADTGRARLAPDEIAALEAYTGRLFDQRTRSSGWATALELKLNPNRLEYYQRQVAAGNINDDMPAGYDLPQDMRELLDQVDFEHDKDLTIKP